MGWVVAVPFFLLVPTGTFCPACDLMKYLSGPFFSSSYEKKKKDVSFFFGNILFYERYCSDII